MSAPAPLVLHALFTNTALKPRLVILQDCPAQSAQPLIRQLISTSTLFLIASQHSLRQPQPSPSYQLNIALLATHHDATHSPEYQRILQAVALHKSSPLSILIDSVQELIRLLSPHLAFKFLRSLLDILPNPESRLIVVDSPHLQTSSSKSLVVDSSALLRSASLSTSYLHLRMHPTSLLDHLINVFGLSVPVPSGKQVGTHYDPRLFALMDELAEGCDPYLAPMSSEGKHPLVVIPQALMAPSSAANTGTCILEWSAKNLSLCATSPSASIALKPSSNKKNPRISSHLASVQHGLEALKLLPVTDLPSGAHFKLVPLPVSQVLVKRTLIKLADRPIDQTVPNPVRDGNLTFNLSLTDKQRAEREAVALPFLPRRAADGTVIEAPGQIFDGSFQNKASSAGKIGRIDYQPDSADDLDEDEPDDDDEDF